MKDNLRQLLKLFFDIQVVVLLLIFLLLGLFLGRFIWVGPLGSQLTGEATREADSPSTIPSLEIVENQRQQTTAVQLPTTYVVQSGDSSWRLAESFYGDPYRYREIERANGLAADQWLAVGQELTIPSLAAQPAAEELSPEADDLRPAEPDPAETEPYIVSVNDSLWFIALKYLDDGERWDEIYLRNRPLIGNDPNLIYPGQTLIIPTELTK